MSKQLRGIEVYLVYIDPDGCDGCEECVHYCPVDVFDIFEKATAVRPQNCLGCGTCAAVCRTDAIVITEI